MRFALFGPTREAFGSFMAISRKVFTCEADCYVSLSMTTLVMLDSKYAPFLKWAHIFNSPRLRGFFIAEVLFIDFHSNQAYYCKIRRKVRIIQIS